VRPCGCCACQFGMHSSLTTTNRVVLHANLTPTLHPCQIYPNITCVYGYYCFNVKSQQDPNITLIQITHDTYPPYSKHRMCLSCNNSNGLYNHQWCSFCCCKVSNLRKWDDESYTWHYLIAYLNFLIMVHLSTWFCLHQIFYPMIEL
jgi:hypothetical protein